jgi:hypothetical protein
MLDKMGLSNKARELRENLGVDPDSPVDIFALVQNIEDLSLIFYPLSKNISGACYKGEDSKLILINSNMSVGRQRFSLAHELFHAYYDENMETSLSLSQIGSGDEREKEADQFASYFLLPQYSLEKIIKNKNNKRLELEDIIRLEQYFGLSHQAMLYRLLDEGFISKDEKNSMQTGIISKAARLGYDISLYYPSSEEKKTLSFGHYMKLAERLLEDDLISLGKYEELLLDAFRDDIVYGENFDGGQVLD